jgi:hypothetical protein
MSVVRQEHAGAVVRQRAQLARLKRRWQWQLEYRGSWLKARSDYAVRRRLMRRRFERATDLSSALWRTIGLC